MKINLKYFLFVGLLLVLPNIALADLNSDWNSSTCPTYVGAESCGTDYVNTAAPNPLVCATLVTMNARNNSSTPNSCTNLSGKLRCSGVCYWTSNSTYCDTLNKNTTTVTANPSGTTYTLPSFNVCGGCKTGYFDFGAGCVLPGGGADLWETDDTNVWRLSDNVGIGTVAPDRELHIKENVSGIANGLRIQNETETRDLRLWVGSSGAVIDAYTGANLHLRTENTDRLYIQNSTGNIGIGTASPNAKLHIGSDAADYESGDLVILSNVYPTIEFNDTTASAMDYWLRANGDRFYILPDDGTGATWSTNRPFTVYQGDKVGIMKDTPAYTLEVGGTAAFDTDTLFVDATNDRVGIDTQAPEAKLHIATNVDVDLLDSNASLIVGGLGSGAHLEMDQNEVQAKSNATTPTILRLQSNGGNLLVDTDTLYVDSANNKVGIGKAPSWELDVDGSANATEYCINGANCITAWSEGAWTVSGANVYRASGNVGIGADTTPDYALDVEGSAAFDTDTLFVDSVNDKVGIGTVTPAGAFHISTVTEADLVNSDASLLIGISGTSKHLEMDNDEIQAKSDMSHSGDLKLQEGGGDLSVNATDLYVATATNRVGINNSTPQYALDVTGTVDASEYCIDGANCIIAWPSTGAWTVSGSDVYRASGKVGIGTGTPSGYLHIATASPVDLTDAAASLVVGGVAGAAHIEMDADEIQAKATQTTVGTLFLQSRGGDLYIGTNNDLYVDESANAVGIGTSSPTGNLHIATNSLVDLTDSIASFVVGGAGGASHIEMDANDIQAKSNAVTASTLYLQNSGGNLAVHTDDLYVDSTNQRVGIGTTAPDVTLHVAGGVQISNGAYDTNFGWGGWNYISGNGVIFRNTTNTEGMRFDAASNRLGIQQAAPAYPLDVTGQARFTSGIGTGGQTATTNWGIKAEGSETGGYFEDSDNTSHAYAAYSGDGIQGYGNHAGGYFFGDGGKAETYVAVKMDDDAYDYGIHAEGNTMGGYFGDSSGSSSYLKAGFGVYGSYAYGQSNTTASSIGAYGNGYNITGGNAIGVSGNGYASGGTSTGVYGYASGGTSTGVYGYASGGGTSTGVVGNGSTYNFNATGTGVDYGTGSSIRWKRNIEAIPDALDKVVNLRGVYFDWDKKHGGQHDMGMIAEEVGKIVPEVVVYEEDGSGYASGMDYGALTPLLTEAIKQLKAEKDAEIAELKAIVCLDHPEAELCK